VSKWTALIPVFVLGTRAVPYYGFNSMLEASTMTSEILRITAATVRALAMGVRS